MSGTASRLLELLSLLQARRDWTGPELARRLEVSARTVRRDADRLRSLGYPVHSLSGPGGDTGWRRAPPCRRCSSTRTRPSRSRWACGPPPGRP